jgi:hypothetical protein
MTPHQHLRALTDELTKHTTQAKNTPKGRRLLKLLSTRIDGLLHPPAPTSEQRVNDKYQRATREAEQRVIDDSPIITIPHLMDAPPVMITRNPTAKRILRNTPRLHCCITCNNTPGILSVPNMVPPTPTPTTPAARQKWPLKPTRVQPHHGPRSTRKAIPSGAQQRVVRRHAINILTLKEQASFDTIHTLHALMKHAKMRVDMEHYANPMVHPVTGHTISSYKKLMHDPTTAEVWQTAFGKDFGGMVQGCNKTGQKGTNAMFVMTHGEIRHALANKKFFTYANPVVDYRPQKDEPHRIRTTAGRNLVNYDGDVSVCTADLDTAKLHWNSVISTENAR